MKYVLYTLAALQTLTLINAAYYGSPWNAWLTFLSFATGLGIGVLLSLLWLDIKGELT